jgi:chromate transporter
MILIRLFISFFKTGLFAVGGAYSFLPLIEREVVDKYHWLTREEFLDVLGLVKVFPGAISIKYATYTGYKVAGFPGIVAANIGNLLAPMLLVVFATLIYSKYKNLPSVKGAFNMVQVVVFSMLIAVAFQLVNINHLIQFRSMLVVIVSFILFMYTKVHPALIIIGAGIVGAIVR